jgi:release factor glutamine methyltransferase
MNEKLYIQYKYTAATAVSAIKPTPTVNLAVIDYIIYGAKRMHTTISQALDVSKIAVSSREAEVLLAHTLGCSREHLFAHPEHLLTQEQQTTYTTYLNRRQTNEPVAYITGVKEFYGRKFKCDARALIPRPETEGVIDLAVDFLQKSFATYVQQHNKPCPVSVLELGTGCGNIATSLVLELQAKSIPTTLIATDVSTEALELARENYSLLNPKESPHTKVSFIEADLFDSPQISGKKFDLITANLPYIAPAWKMRSDAQPDVFFHEPDVALFGGDEDGLMLYRNFFEVAASYLREDGKIIIEYGEDQTENLLSISRSAFPKANHTVHKDYAGLDRILEVSQ